LIPSVSLHVVGRPVAAEEPLKSGLRHCGQFAALAATASKETTVRKTDLRMGRGGNRDAEDIRVTGAILSL
jgi:hypothetical protein